MWSNIVKKAPVKKLENTRKVQPNVSKKNVVPDNSSVSIRYQNVDEQFEKIYSRNIDDSVGEFRNYLENSQIFVQPNNRLTTELYKFVKYNCYNVDSVETEVDRYNDNLDRELKEEEDDEYE